MDCTWSSCCGKIPIKLIQRAMKVLAVTALELCQMPGGHRENWRWSQKHRAKSTFRKGECLIMSKLSPKGSQCQKGKIKLLMGGTSSCQQPVSQTFGSPKAGAEVQEETSRGQEDTKSLQAGMGMRRSCHWPLHLCLLSPPVPALPPFVPFGCVRTFYRCHLKLRAVCSALWVT